MDDEKDKEEEEEEEEEAEAAAVADFVREEVGDWEDDAMMTRARFKAFSGQRSDWEPLYQFWRELIIKVARHRRTFIIRPSRVIRLWFRRPKDGISPLCLPSVLLEICRSGDLLLPTSHFQQTTNSSSSSSSSPTYSRLLVIFRKALKNLTLYAADDDSIISGGEDHYYILSPLLEEQALRVVNSLSEAHWTASCIVSMNKFQDICLGRPREALEILSYLSSRGRATHLVIRKTVPIEGVKVCLAPGAVPDASGIDYSVLHLVWTSEKLEQQLDLIDQRYQKTRNLALSALKSGNRRVALRFAKELKLASISREQCTGLLDRVERVLQVISDAESSKKVSEAIKSSTDAIRDNQIPVEDVELCLHEVAENIDSLTRLDDVLKQIPAFEEMDFEGVENEFKKLQLEIGTETNHNPGVTGLYSSAGTAEDSDETDAITRALSNLNLDIKDGAGLNSMAEFNVEPVQDKSMSKEGSAEAA